jgi:hypothetical protein
MSRKLITEDTLSLLTEAIELGVPLSRAIRDQELSMSRPAVQKLVTQYSTWLFGAQDQGIYDSLFPEWLVHDEQVQPDNVRYLGYFPLGRWEQR